MNTVSAMDKLLGPFIACCIRKKKTSALSKKDLLY